MMYEPFRDNIFLLLEKMERMTASGVIIPDTVNGTEYGAKKLVARVMKAGAGGMGYNGDSGEFQFFSVDVTQGDRVLIEWDAGEKVIVGDDIRCASAPELEAGTEIRVVRNEEILAVLAD